MAEQSTKCSKCGKVIAQGEGKALKNGMGTICPECVKKRKKGTIGWLFGGILVVSATAIGIIIGQNKVDSFEGIGNINDDITIQEIETKTFDISKSDAISLPTSVGDAIDNIELFKSKVQSSLESLTSNDTKIELPSVAVLFSLNSSDIPQEGKDLLNEFAKIYCQTNKESFICVDGYTCDLGSAPLNDELSLRRANNVKQVLISTGVPIDKIKIKGYGKSMFGKLGLIGRDANRRANIYIQ